MEFPRDRRLLWLIGVIVLVTALVYLPSVARDRFVSIDDTLLITKNAAVVNFTPGALMHVFTSYDPELYIPLTLFSYQLEYAFAGGYPPLFHLTNLLLHIGSAVLLFFLLRRLFRHDIIAFLGALLFAVHPMNSEAVLWAAARKDVLSSFFFIGSLYLYEYSREEDDERTLWGSVGLFFLGLLSKVTVATLPVVLLLLDWRRGEMPTLENLRKKLPYVALSTLFIVIALFGKARGIGALGIRRTLLLGAKSTLFYLEKIVAPIHQSVIYMQTTPVTVSSMEFFLPVLVVILLCAAIVLLAMRYRNIAVGLAFFLLTLVPNFANFWKNRFIFFASDRYVYIPVIGLILILCGALVWVHRHRPSAERPATIVLGVITAIFAIMTYQQTAVWQSDISLYTNVLRWYPDSALAANNLGDAYFNAGNKDQALIWFTQAATERPDYIQSLDNVGGVLEAQGKYEEARTWYEKGVKAISRQPLQEDLAPHYRLGALLINMGKTEEGLAQFHAAVMLLPRLSEANYNLATQLHKLGRGDEAIPYFVKAVEYNALDIDSRYHLAGLYAERGRLPEAKEQLEKIVAVDPGYEKAAAHLADIERLMGE